MLSQLQHKGWAITFWVPHNPVHCCCSTPLTLQGFNVKLNDCALRMGQHANQLLSSHLLNEILTAPMASSADAAPCKPDNSTLSFNATSPVTNVCSTSIHQQQNLLIQDCTELYKPFCDSYAFCSSNMHQAEICNAALFYVMSIFASHAIFAFIC